jgi:AcrR family transcriptional regulator
VSLSPSQNNKTLRRRREILEGASRVFRERGLHATGMRDIAAELDMHVGNLYYYFRNKQDLLAFCQQDALDGLLSRARTVRKEELRADTQLFKLIYAHVHLLNYELPASLAHLEIEALEPEVRQPVLRQRDEYERLLRETVDEGIQSGLFRPTDPKVATLAILGAVNWTVKWFRPGGPAKIAEIARQFAEYLVMGLLTPGIQPEFPDSSELAFLVGSGSPSPEQRL